MKFFAGVDYQYRYIRSKDSATERSGNGQTNLFGRVFKKNYHAGDFYVRDRFHENLGFELGYAQSAEKTVNHKAVSGDFISILNIPAGRNVRTKLAFKSWHADLNAYLPLGNDLDLVGTVGFSYLKPDLKEFSVTGISFSTKGEYSFIPRLGAGAQFMLNDCIGVRGLLRWESTSQAKVRIADTLIFKPFKNGLTANVGLFITT